MTVSLGVTDAAAAGRSVRAMLHSADVALHAAKRAGRDRVVRADALQGSDGAPLATFPLAGVIGA